MLTDPEREPEQRLYAVVTSIDGYYSIWPVGSEPPEGWAAEGFNGSEDECAAHIDEVWTGLDPRSLRNPS